MSAPLRVAVVGSGPAGFYTADALLKSEEPAVAVVVIGNGNVAIDCARMLALTRDELASTDTIDPAAEAIVASPLREILMVGRRGPVQASFTPPEVKELGELAGAEPVVDPRDLVLDPASEAELEADRERVRRNFELLQEYAARRSDG